MREQRNQTDMTGLEVCPECGSPSFSYNDENRRHVCVNEECGYAEDVGGESIFTQLLRLLRIKKGSP
jgi:hypothetical protein